MGFCTWAFKSLFPAGFIFMDVITLANDGLNHGIPYGRVGGAISDFLLLKKKVMYPSGHSYLIFCSC